MTSTQVRTSCPFYMRAITAELLPLGAMSPDDIRDFTAWVTSIPNNFDPGVMGYPRIVMARALADGEPFAYVPLQPVLMFESLAPKPGTSPLQIAQGLREISTAVDGAGQASGFGEAYFLTNSQAEMELCSKRGCKSVLHDSDRNMWLMKRTLPRLDFRTP